MAAVSPTAPTFRSLEVEDSAPSRGGGHRPSFAQILRHNQAPLFRPAGQVGMHQLHDWSGLDVGGYALELGSEVGRTGGMQLAHRFGCHVTLTNDDPAKLTMAHPFAKQELLADEQWETKVMEMTQVGAAFAPDKQFDCAIVEQAALTYRDNRDKQIIVHGLAKHTKQVLLHEFCLLGDAQTSEVVAEQVRMDLAHALEQEVHVVSEQHWRLLLQEAGLEVAQIETGPVRLFDPKWLLQEEQGLAEALHSVWNLATHEELRLRFLEMHDVLEAHKAHLGYVLIKAVRLDPNRPAHEQLPPRDSKIMKKKAWIV